MSHIDYADLTSDQIKKAGLWLTLPSRDVVGGSQDTWQLGMPGR
jgi:hypothetical protein